MRPGGCKQHMWIGCLPVDKHGFWVQEHEGKYEARDFHAMRPAVNQVAVEQELHGARSSDEDT